MRYLLWSPDQGFGGKFVLSPRTTDDMIGYKSGPGATPGRVYGYDIAPSYLSVTIWCFASGGRRLRSDRFHPSQGSSHRERYDACATLVRNFGMMPPSYLA